MWNFNLRHLRKKVLLLTIRWLNRRFGHRNFIPEDKKCSYFLIERIALVQKRARERLNSDSTGKHNLLCSTLKQKLLWQPSLIQKEISYLFILYAQSVKLMLKV